MLSCGKSTARSFVSDAMMSEAKTITFSQYYRTRAEDCRARGNLFRDPAARAEMFKLAIDYDLKSKEAEAAEAVQASSFAGRV